MNNIYDALEICLQDLENGADLESVLARYPDLAGELHPILKASVMARARSVVAPSPDAVRRGRAKVMQRASEMREAKVAPRKRMIPLFQRLAISFTLATFFLASGTGLVGASSSALPGEHLYPVKRTWEDLRLFFTFDLDHKNFLESEFDSERLDEVGELIVEGRHETIQFAGVFTQLNGMDYVSGVPVLIPADLQAPVSGTAVIITGRTNAQGFVELETIDLLPDGVFVPVGQPVKVDMQSDSNSNSDPDKSSHDNFEVEGIVESLTDTTLVINGKTVYLDNPTVEGDLMNGVKVEIEGYYTQDGRFIVTTVEVESSGSRGNDGFSISNNNNDGEDNENSNGGSSDEGYDSSDDGDND